MTTKHIKIIFGIQNIGIISCSESLLTKKIFFTFLFPFFQNFQKILRPKWTVSVISIEKIMQRLRCPIHNGTL